MRHIVTLTFTCLCAGFLSAQTTPQKTFSEKLDGIHTSGRELTKNASSDKASIGQAGVMTTSIPLVQVKSRTMEFPLQLHYTSGIKADQQSGPVGLGWALPLGSIVRDYGSYEPDYTSTTGEAKMLNTGAMPSGWLNPSGDPVNPDSHNEVLGNTPMDADAMEMGMNDQYHLHVPGFIGNTFWNGGQLGDPHDWKWSSFERWKVSHRETLFSVDQEFTRINEFNLDQCGNCASKDYFGYGGSYAAAIGVLPYVVEGEAHIPSSMPVYGDERYVKYTDISSFTITDDNGVVYIFGRPLRGQKYVFSDNPYWSASSYIDFYSGSEAPDNAPYGNFWKIDYIAEWLLTEIRSADFADLNGNGIADDGDQGDWMRFEYTAPTKVVQGVQHGSANYMQTEVPAYREWSSFSQTDQASSLMRERAYLTRIVTPVQEVDLTISQRFEVDHDYFAKPANKQGTGYYYENRKFSTSGTTGSTSDFDIHYPVETMKYDSIFSHSRLVDKSLYTGENDLLGLVVLKYAEKGAANELAVSEYLIRNNNDEAKVYTNGTHIGAPSDSFFDVENLKNESDKRGKTTLLGVELSGGDLNNAQKTSYTFEYAYNPSYNEIHKRNIVESWSHPSVRQSGDAEYEPKRTAPIASYTESILQGDGITWNTEVHEGIHPDNFLISFPYHERIYTFTSPTQAEKENCVRFDMRPDLIEEDLTATEIQKPLTPVTDIYGYLYAENCTLCPQAWSLTGITYPTGARQTFEYEPATYNPDEDRANWSFDEKSVPLAGEYNDLAKARSAYQDLYNQYLYGQYLLADLPVKTLYATFEVDLPAYYGIRLKSKTLNDRVNAPVTIRFEYGTGHSTTLPAEYVANYGGAFHQFMIREKNRHNWERYYYHAGITAALPSYINDFTEKMSYVSPYALAIDDYHSAFFYETIDHIFADNSRQRLTYNSITGDIDDAYAKYEVYCTEFPVAGKNGRFSIGGNSFFAQPVALVKTESFESGATTPYSSETNEYTYQLINTRIPVFDYDGSGATSLTVWDNDFEFWMPIWGEPGYPPFGVGYGCGGWYYTDLNISAGPSTDPYFYLWMTTGGVNQGSAFVFEWDNVLSASATIQTTAGLYQKWGTSKLMLNTTTTNYKGLVSEKAYTFDPATYVLREEQKSATYTNDVYITRYTYADEVYQGITTAFADKNLLKLPGRTNVYLNTVNANNVLSAGCITYKYTGYSIPRPDKSWAYETALNSNGTFTLTDFNIASGSNPGWRMNYTYDLGYGRNGASISSRTNALFTRDVYGFGNNTVKAQFSYPEHQFDATYSGFEDLSGRQNISEWVNTDYQREQWFEHNSSSGSEPAYSMWIYQNPCGTDIPPGENLSQTRYKNVVTVDNLAGLNVGDMVEVELTGSSDADPSPYVWSIQTTITAILDRAAYWPDGTGSQNIQNNMKDYILCFSDPLEFPGSTLQAANEAPGVMNEKAWATIARTTVSIPVRYSVSDMYSRTGTYSYQLRTQRDQYEPFRKTPVRPVKIEELPVSNNCINEQSRAAMSPEELIGTCIWEYEASLWLNYSRDILTSVPDNQFVPKSADPTGDAIYRRGEVSDTDNDSGVKIICEVWNSNRSALLDQYIYYPEGLSDDWQQYTVRIPVDKGAVKWVDVYVQNEIAQLQEISTEESMSLFVDDICVYPKGAKYAYTTFDKFGNPTFITNNDDVFSETVYDEKGRPTTQKNQYGKIISELAYFENPNWSYQNNHVTERIWVDNGLYNETRYYLDGFGKTKQVMVTDVTRNARIATQTLLYDDQGRIVRSYKPYAISGSSFGNKYNNEYDIRTQNLYGSYYAFTNVTYAQIPEEKIAAVEPPRTNSESYFASTQSDYVSTAAKSHPVTAQNYPSGTLLVHETVDQIGNKVWTYLDNLGRVILEEHEIGNTHTQNNDGSITIGSAGYSVASTWFTYDGGSRITQVLDPSGKITTYEYNSLGVITARNSPDAGRSEMCYDKYGQVRMTRNAKDVNAVANNTWDTDQFSYLKYDVWGRVTEGGFMEAAQSNPAGIFTPDIFFGDTAYLNNPDFPEASRPLVQIHQVMEYDGNRDQFNSNSLLTTTVHSNHQYAGASMTYAPGKTDVTSMEYMADGQIAATEYLFDGLSGTHRFEQTYNSMRRPAGKNYIHPSDNAQNFTWSSQYDNMGRSYRSASTHNNITVNHVTTYFDLLGNPLISGIGETGNPADPHIDYQTIRFNIRDQLVHGVSEYFRYGLKYTLDGNISDQYWSSEYYDPTGGTASHINRYQYTYDQMQRLIGADYSDANVTGNPFTYYGNISGTMPDDFYCGVNAGAFSNVFDPIFDELQGNIDNRVNVKLSNACINTLGILQAVYLDNDVAWASMDSVTQNTFLSRYVDASQSSSEDPHAWEKYRAEQENDRDHLNLINSTSPGPTTLKYTRLNLFAIVFVPEVQCDQNPNATVYGYLPGFPYPATVPSAPYDVAAWYSENGNIEMLNRNDQNGTKTEQTYTYGNTTGNHLTSVEWDDQVSPVTHNYTYDLTGNLLADSRNNISNINYISYNNMPQSITNATATMNYRYNALQQRSVKEIGSTEKQYYVDGVILDENNEVISYQVPGGYAVPASAGVRCYYIEKDWLGTNRAVIDEDGVLQNVADHYPFGLRMPGRVMVTDEEGNRYQYTGHEFDSETGYGYHGARYYNRELGRYMSVDPMAKYHESPYAYSANNPIYFVDPNGKDTAVFNYDGVVIYKAESENPVLLYSPNNNAKDEKSLVEIALNDPDMDRLQIDRAQVGDVLVRKLDFSEVNWLMSYSGADDIDAGIYGINFIYAGIGAYGELDFAVNYLIPALKDEYPHLSQLASNYGQWDKDGGLIMFTEAKLLRAFNVPDAGNFLFGVAANRMNISRGEVLFGAQVNEGFTDSQADQNAIYLGYTHANQIELYHTQSNLIPSLSGYEKSRPDFFSKDMDYNAQRSSRPHRSKPALQDNVQKGPQLKARCKPLRQR